METHKPLVSVICPSLNLARFVRQTVQSVIDQDYPNIELIVMDGGSNDGTIEILSHFNDVRTFVQADTGVEEALQNGIKKSRGDLIMFMMISDSYADKTWISTCVEAMERSPDISLFWGLPRYISEDGDIGSIGFQRLLNETDLARKSDFTRWLKTGQHFPECNMCVRREVIQKVFLDINNADRSLDIFLEFSKRFHIEGYMSGFIAVVANYGRDHSGQRGKLERKAGVLAIRERNYRRCRFSYARRILCSSQQHQFRLPNGASVDVLTLGLTDRIWIGFLIIVNESKRVFINAAIATKAKGLRVRSFKL